MAILIIEDELSIADNLIHVLEMDGFEVTWCATAGEGLTHLKEVGADLLVLDVGLPDANGFELCKHIREFSSVPIIFLTARNDEIDRIVGLEIGADDYVTKPFSPREMVARIKLRIKSRPMITPTVLVTSESLTNTLYSDNFDYHSKGNPIGLTAVEFKILDKLIKVTGNVLSREQLMIAADMPQDSIYERNIDSHIKAIRHKLKSFGLSDRIGTKRGFGYYYTTQEI
ncbi:response regulator [Aliivibrio fischeri]|uniref:response regulator n=1 Tax=Aliivibrio fischeri TaxID=668 RepID=UPI0012D947B7|nr:response regulator [Aliivibrio fischeri]MUK92856.1 response regulator [Aliivibrio fischeri]